jgi:H+-transporting ATPase
MRKVASPQMLLPAGAAAITGLRSDEAQRLREQHGANIGQEQRPRPVAMTAHLLSSPIPWMLEAAIVLDIVLA